MRPCAVSAASAWQTWPFARMMDDDDGQREPALQATQVREQGGDVGRGVFIDPVQADEGVEHEEDRPHRGDGGLEVLPIFAEIETQAGRGDDVDRQLGERDVRRATDAVEPRADQMQGVLSGVQEHRAAISQRRSGGQTGSSHGRTTGKMVIARAPPAARVAARPAPV
jgi:hypothetical protein